MSIDKLVTSVRHQSDAKSMILIADDSRVVRVSLKNILLEDYNIIEAEDGAIAWNILLNEPDIRLVFSDLSMPNLDGLDLLRNVRQSDDKRIQNIPFIVVTGKEDDQEIRNQLLHQGANDLITKPFVAHEIEERAKRHIKLQQKNTGNIAEDDEFLTGITNKSLFIQNVRKGLSFAIRNKNELALLLLKLDQFETIKKHYSDPAIEHILITTAEIIRAHTHIEDKISYFGEGAFAILLPASNAISTRYLGKRILADLLAKKFYIGESDATITASIGVSAPEIKQGTTFSEILHLAEQRLQAAINAGGQRVVDKGNATITPVSTLLSDENDEESTQDKFFKETEIEMRELATQEVNKIQANRKLENEIDSNLINAQEVNDALLLAEQENKLIKQELVKLRQQVEEIDQLKQQLHETDSLQQQTQLKLKQLRTDYEEMRARAEEAESHQAQSQEPDIDNSIVQQHLLQESEQLQNQLNAANQRAEQSLAAFRKSEMVISNIKQQLKTQKDEFESVLAEEHTKRSIAEERVLDLEARLVNSKKKQSQFTLSAAPMVTLVEKTDEATVPKTPQVVPARSVPTQSAKTKPIKIERSSPLNDEEKPNRIRLLKFAAIAIAIVVGITGYLLWQQFKSHSQDNSTTLSHMGKQQITTANSKNNSSLSPTDGKPLDRDLTEEARLQAELALREAADEEFQIQLHK